MDPEARTQNTSRDLELVLRAQGGDSEAFGELYDAYGEKIYAFFMSRIRHPASAEELTSTTFFKALEKIAQFRVTVDASFSGWIYAIARNVLADYWRGAKVHEDVDAMSDLTSADDPAEAAEHALRMQEADRLLALLSPLEQEMVRLRLWDECSYQEIATALDKTEAACKMGYARALKKLKSTYA